MVTREVWKMANWNVVTFGDAIDGMRSIPDKEIDLGFADPPFNIGLEENVNSGKAFKNTKASKKVYYEDDMDPADYKAFCAAWLSEMIRACKKVIVYCSSNIGVFYDIRKPLDQIIYFTPFNDIITSCSWAGRHKTLLAYADDKNAFLGRPPGENCKFDSSVIVKRERFFDSTEESDRKNVLVHPCPIDRELMNAIFSQLKPRSFLDPFAGSGTTLYMAKQHKVRFVAFEVIRRYKKDQDYLLGKPLRAVENRLPVVPPP